MALNIPACPYHYPTLNLTGIAYKVSGTWVVCKRCRADKLRALRKSNRAGKNRGVA